MAPKFADNIILTKTERLMMSNRPPDPKNARNKNVLVVGGSGSGKTRFFIKPNLLQCDSKNFPVSFVVTDPKGSIGVIKNLVLPLPEPPTTSTFLFRAFLGSGGRLDIIRRSVLVRMILSSNFGAINGSISLGPPHEAFCQVLF